MMTEDRSIHPARSTCEASYVLESDSREPGFPVHGVFNNKGVYVKDRPSQKRLL